MDALTIRERKVVVNYAQKDMTFSQISTQMGLSESQVSRIYKKAIEKMKRAIEGPKDSKKQTRKKKPVS